MPQTIPQIQIIKGLRTVKNIPITPAQLIIYRKLQRLATWLHRDEIFACTSWQQRSWDLRSIYGLIKKGLVKKQGLMIKTVSKVYVNGSSQTVNPVNIRRRK